mgnify:CR=1 FL=1
MTTNNPRKELGKMLKQRRLMIPLTLRQIATKSGISPSHLGRIEKGERFPSAAILRKVAKPLGFEESELFRLAGYLSYPSFGVAEEPAPYEGKQIDPYVLSVLSGEPVEIQQVVIGLLTIVKNIARAMK